MKGRKAHLNGRVVEPILDDYRQEGPESIQNRHNSDLDASMYPTLDILRSFLNIGFTIVAGAARICFGSFSSSSHNGLLIVIQEVGCLVVLRHNEYADEGPDDGYDAFDDVKPGVASQWDSVEKYECISRDVPTPARPSSYAIHIQNTPSNQAPESA